MHAAEEMISDDLLHADLEEAILTGSIIERQKDEVSGEWKFLVHGYSLDEDDIIVVIKRGVSNDSVVITVYRDHD